MPGPPHRTKPGRAEPWPVLTSPTSRLSPQTVEFVILSFEGPDLYSLIGGLGVRATELASTLAVGGSYPRVRLSSSLTWTPNEVWSINWTADWQAAQDIVQLRDWVLNADSRSADQLNTDNFVRNDFTVRWNVRDDLSVRAGVVNAFDAEQPSYLGTTLYSNFDPYGRRFFVGLNFRPW